MATGLSGLYSLLPRRLEGRSFVESNFKLSHDDVSRIPELENFLSSLEFCDAVIQVVIKNIHIMVVFKMSQLSLSWSKIILQVAHPTVRQYLLGLIYMGFLVPVLGPALTQVKLKVIQWKYLLLLKRSLYNRFASRG